MRSVNSFPAWRVLRAYGRRNPLVRTSDKIELFIIASAVLIAMVATAFAGALGTAVHDVRSRVYLAEAQTRHTVVATTVDDSTTVWGVGHDAVTSVDARWQVERTEHVAGLTVDAPIKAGEPLDIWVDRQGDRVDAPTPTSHAAIDAVGVAYGALQTVVFTLAGLVWCARSALDRRRMSGWERELRVLVHGGGSGDRKS